MTERATIIPCVANFSEDCPQDCHLHKHCEDTANSLPLTTSNSLDEHIKNIRILYSLDGGKMLARNTMEVLAEMEKIGSLKSCLLYQQKTQS